TDMKLIDDEIMEGGRAETRVMPGKAGIANHAIPIRPVQFPGVRIALHSGTGRSGDPELVGIKFRHARDIALPVAIAAGQEEGVVLDVKSIEAAADVNGGGVGRPDA